MARSRAAVKTFDAGSKISSDAVTLSPASVPPAINTRPSASRVAGVAAARHGQGAHQGEGICSRVKDLRDRARRVARLEPAGDQHSAVYEQGGGVIGPWPIQAAEALERLGCRIEDLNRIDPLVVAPAADDQNPAILQARGGVTDPRGPASARAGGRRPAQDQTARPRRWSPRCRESRRRRQPARRPATSRYGRPGKRAHGQAGERRWRGERRNRRHEGWRAECRSLYRRRMDGRRRAPGTRSDQKRKRQPSSKRLAFHARASRDPRGRVDAPGRFVPDGVTCASSSAMRSPNKRELLGPLAVTSIPSTVTPGPV